MRIRQARVRGSTMIDALSKGLNQKPAMIKGRPPVSPSRGFALWLALLFLYSLLLPGVAQTPGRDAGFTASAAQSPSSRGLLSPLGSDAVQPETLSLGPEPF